MITRACWSVLLALSLLLTPWVIGQERTTGSDRPNVPIDFVGFLPGNQDDTYSGFVPVEFSIYLTPTGGRAMWSEKQVVQVSNGKIHIRLGEQCPIPWAITIANFKFLSARVSGGTEVLPRMPIVNVVYSQSKSSSGQTGSYGSLEPLERTPRPSSTWEDALHTAAKEGKQLPRYYAWYEAASRGILEDCFGHYEWTLPWVYDTASHGDLNDHFRGRFQGCDFMDLDPSMNRYAFRLCAAPTRRQ